MQRSSVAPVDGETRSSNLLQRDEGNPRLRALCKAHCKYISIRNKSLLLWSNLNLNLQEGITLLLINIDRNTTLKAKVDFNGTLKHHHHSHNKHRSRGGSLLHHRKQVSEAVREEYHLTPSDGNIQSRTVLLNGKALTIDSFGDIPSLEPVRVNSSELITVAPYSIVFVSMPTVSIPACL